MLSLAQVREHPMFASLNPEGRKFIKQRSLPPAMNPFRKHNVNMAALVAFGEFPHIKTVPAWQMLLDDFEAGVLNGIHTVVARTSGNTGHGLALAAKAYGLKLKLVMSTDVPSSKIDVLRAFGDNVDVMQVSNTIEAAAEEAKKPGHYELDQYSHPGNVRSHRLYTGPEIVRALGGIEPAILAVATGSAGTIAGVSEYFRDSGRDVQVVAVRPTLGQQVPGARDKKKMEAVVRFSWEDKVAAVIEVGRHESFVRTRRLWDAVQPQPGPTSGLAWAGLELYLSRTWAEQADRLSGRTVAFLCPDDGRFYTAPMLAELDPDEGVEEL